MKVLSIKQPWAWLICAGYKDIENRDWRIGRKPALGGLFQNRGLELPSRIYVHAGKQFDKDGYGSLFDVKTKIHPQIIKTLEDHVLVQGTLYGCGAIIGEVDIVDCVEKSESPWFVGKYGFVLANPVLYDKPIPYRGQLGFFEVKLP